MMKVKLLNESASVPTKAHSSDAGWDLYASYTSQPVYPHKRRLISTDISIAIPDGYCGLIWPRSGLSVKKGIDVLAGVIDSGYRGDIGVILYNSKVDRRYKIQKGDRIAQILFQKIEDFDLVEVDSLDSSERGAGGFGSTGKC